MKKVDAATKSAIRSMTREELEKAYIKLLNASLQLVPEDWPMSGYEGAGVEYLYEQPGDLLSWAESMGFGTDE